MFIKTSQLPQWCCTLLPLLLLLHIYRVTCMFYVSITYPNPTVRYQMSPPLLYHIDLVNGEQHIGLVYAHLPYLALDQRSGVCLPALDQRSGVVLACPT